MGEVRSLLGERGRRRDGSIVSSIVSGSNNEINCFHRLSFGTQVTVWYSGTSVKITQLCFGDMFLNSDDTYNGIFMSPKHN